jgi:hypothetical protein
MKTRSCIAGVAVAWALGGLLTTAVAADMACGKPMTEAQKVQRLLDIQAIMNTASLHEYYHGAWMHQAEIDNIWAKKATDVSWTNNNDKYIGMKSFHRFYVEGAAGLPTKGLLAYHMLTTPVIEVAGDGKTAKGIFMSFGNVAGARDGKAEGQWTEEKYGIDFIKEAGQWKIWHLRTYVEFYVPINKLWTDPGANEAATTVAETPKAPGEQRQATVKSEPGVTFEMARPDQQGNFYAGYTPDREPSLVPELPKPYCKFSETFSY